MHQEHRDLPRPGQVWSTRRDRPYKRAASAVPFSFIVNAVQSDGTVLCTLSSWSGSHQAPRPPAFRLTLADFAEDTYECAETISEP
jgi:hypothetical protein